MGEKKGRKTPEEDRKKQKKTPKYIMFIFLID